MALHELEREIAIVTYAHEGQIRKVSGQPYVKHPIAVAESIAEAGGTRNTQIAGLFHDVLEDVLPERYSEADMRRDVGDEVTDIVRVVTKEAGLTDWRARNLAYLGSIATTDREEALVVCAADKLNNTRNTIAEYAQFGESLWSMFNASGPEQVDWYQRNLVILQARLPEHVLVQQLGGAVAELSSIVQQTSE